jgi:biotin transport system substrate-specific component
LGTKGGAASQILFLLVGLLGIPIFTLGGGPGYVLKPSFGYLAGFPLGAMFIGLFTEKLNDSLNWWKLFVVCSLGMLIILFLGVFYLYVNMNFILQTRIAWYYALWSGIIIFLPGEILKIVITVHLVKRLKPHIRLFEK